MRIDSLLFRKVGGMLSSSGERCDTLKQLCITKEEVRGILDEMSEGGSAISKEINENIEIIGEIFGLDQFEKDIIRISITPEAEPRYERIFAYIQDDMNMKYATPSLIALLMNG